MSSATAEFKPALDITEDECSEIYQVNYGDTCQKALEFAKNEGLLPAAQDRKKVGLMLIDCQNTFCNPKGELFVGGSSGNGAVEDSVRICNFILRNIAAITSIACTLDTHKATQIFHPIFFVDQDGNNPPPMTFISVDDLKSGKWRLNPAVPYSVLGDPSKFSALEKYTQHYVSELEKAGKYQLTIWPFHAMLGGVGHALVSAIEETCFFHNVARNSQTRFEVKGGNDLTENYSVLRPEVLTGVGGQPIAQKNAKFIEDLLNFDYLFIAGQAKSHCVAWTIDDLLNEIKAQDPKLAEKVYLLEDCTSPVVVPGIVDFSDDADKAFDRFKSEGMNVVKSTDSIGDYLNL